MQEERAIVRAVRGLILQLCDYIKIRDENLVDEIIQKLRELASNEAALKLLIKAGLIYGNIQRVLFIKPAYKEEH